MRKEKGNNEKLENIMKQLENGVQQLRSSDKWKEYLIMQSKLPHYSYNNTLLVLWQTKGEESFLVFASDCCFLGNDCRLGRTDSGAGMLWAACKDSRYCSVSKIYLGLSGAKLG